MTKKINLETKSIAMVILVLLLLMGTGVGLWAEGQHESSNNQEKESAENSESSIIDSAVYVNEIKAGSPADTAGLLPDDKILVIEGESATSIELVETLIRRRATGNSITLTILRAEKELSFTLTPEQKTFNKNYVGWELDTGKESDD